jgi:hypothetical protein
MGQLSAGNSTSCRALPNSCTLSKTSVTALAHAGLDLPALAIV